MKLTSVILLCTSTLLLQVTASPVGLDPVLDAEPVSGPIFDDDFGSGANSTASLESRCTWHDGHGIIHCDYFSVVMPNWANYDGVTRFDIKGSNFHAQQHIDCDRPNEWQGFTSPLPFVLSIHPGNPCIDRPIWPSNWDNLWIRYANQHLNALTDSRCGEVGVIQHREMRCIIKQRP
ncbi:hypothetical protein QBC34DRAFT_378276 [Podospora aff. communis PSN243]|uniref:Ecp2 effector protein domain-containing protein n=1 Tax=Podospora aff. communis PSN243 TaxID=3040156 RepID=A0AAV9GTU8_9PEZI|nr:hypothetical protein QBC34DRAFT_378276 [Podospora aff. communis PSN243]